jgi:hypothetical protein
MALLAGRLVTTRARTWIRTGIVVGLVGASIVSGRVAFDLRRLLAFPVRSTRGTIYATAPQAASLQSLVDGVAQAAPPDVPLASMPYHPLVNFITARRPLTPYYSIWPGEPDMDRTETVERHLDAQPAGLIVYNQSQVPYFARMPEYAPALFAYLADHYRIDRVLGGQAFGFEFLLLRRTTPPLGRALLDRELDRARVVIESADGAVDATPAERVRLVGRSVWPFRRVLRVGAVADATVAVRVPIVPAAGTHVVTSYGVDPDAWSRIPPFQPRFDVAVAAAGTETRIAGGSLAPFAVMADRRWTDVDVDLGRWAGTPVELVLRVASPPGAPAFDDRTGFGEPRLVEAPQSP